jgi:hypothetical protein
MSSKTPMAAALIWAAMAFHGLAHASPPTRLFQRSQQPPGVSWPLLRSQPHDWTQGQTIDLSVALGPSNPRYGGLRGVRSRINASAPSPTSTNTATGWTTPLGLRFSIRW